MKLAGFLAGMAVSVVLVAGTAALVGLPALTILALVVLTVFLSQLLYLGLIMLMTKAERQRRDLLQPMDAVSAAAVTRDLVIAGSRGDRGRS